MSLLKQPAICVFQHSKGTKLGENIASFSAGSNDKTTIDLFMKWWVDDELVGISGNGVGVFNHASQVLWAESSKIGCGYTKCGGKLGIFVVCNFDPRGNMHVDGWYLEGPACSKCPSDASKCNNKLCSTGGEISTSNPKTETPVSTTYPTDAPISTTYATEAPISTEAPVSTSYPTEVPISTEAPISTTYTTGDPVVEPTISPTSEPATATFEPSTETPKPRSAC